MFTEACSKKFAPSLVPRPIRLQLNARSTPNLHHTVKTYVAIALPMQIMSETIIFNYR